MNIRRRTKPETREEKEFRIKMEAIEAEEAVRRFLHEQTLLSQKQLLEESQNGPSAGGALIGAFTSDFIGNPLTGVGPLTVTFASTETSLGNLGETFLWAFGDGTSSAERNPSHLYSNTGSYTVTLQVTNSFGFADSESKVNYISASVPAVISAFTMSLTSPTAPTTGTFVNNTTYDGNGSLTYRWLFGSGSTTSSLETPPVFYYTSAGGYTASLQVTESSYNLKSNSSRMFTLS